MFLIKSIVEVVRFCYWMKGIWPSIYTFIFAKVRYYGRIETLTKDEKTRHFLASKLPHT